MAYRGPGLFNINVLASVLLASVAMYCSAPSSCDQRRHVSLMNPIHRYFDQIETRLEHDYPLLLKWSPSKLIGLRNIECRCTDGRNGTAQLREPLRDLVLSLG